MSPRGGQCCRREGTPAERCRSGCPEGPTDGSNRSVKAADDWTGQVRLEGLRPKQGSSCRVRFGGDSLSARGSVRTPPAETKAAAVRLGFGGDVAGQNVCRHAVEGFPIMDAIHAWPPDALVGLGDMIYADNACAAGHVRERPLPGAFGQATDLAGFWAHWRYNRADPGSQRLLANTSYVGVWDDHEVINDSAHSPTSVPGRPTRPTSTSYRSGWRRSSTHTDSERAKAVPLPALGTAPRALRPRHAQLPRRQYRPGQPAAAQDHARSTSSSPGSRTGSPAPTQPGR